MLLEGEYLHHQVPVPLPGSLARKASNYIIVKSRSSDTYNPFHTIDRYIGNYQGSCTGLHYRNSKVPIKISDGTFGGTFNYHGCSWKGNTCIIKYQSLYLALLREKHQTT